MKTFPLLAIAVLGLALAWAASMHSQDREAQVPLVQPPWERRTVLTDHQITESSGLARSVEHPSMIWTHNDSGDVARAFLVDREGKTRSILSLPIPRPIDWEDMTNFQVDGHSYLAFGDIGGNAMQRKSLVITVVEEPKQLPANGAVQDAKPITTITVKIPNKLTDFESLAMAGPKSFLLVEKHILGGRVMEIPFDLHASEQSVEAQVIGTVSIPLATSCDVSPDYSKLAIVSYRHLYVYQRDPLDDGSMASWEKALQREPVKIELPKVTQCEAVSFNEDGSRILITSERIPTPLLEIPFPWPASIDASKGSQP